MARTLPIGGRGTCVSVGAAPLGPGASAVVPLARDGRPFRILVAEVLLQRSRGKTVATVYERLFERWTTADALSRARVNSIASVIRPLGLVRRAATLKSLAAAVVERGSVPDSMEELMDFRASAVTRRAPRSPSRSSSVLRWSTASAPGSTGGTLVCRRPRLPRPTPALGARVGDHAAPDREWNWSVLDWRRRCVSRRFHDAKSVHSGRVVPGQTYR